LGYAPFAERVAEAIVQLPSSEGLVVGLYGTWGAGKTTTLNYVVHYLGRHSGKTQPSILWFNPWWFSGKEDLVRVFFQQLRGHLGGLRYYSRALLDQIARLADLASEVEPRFKLFARLRRPKTVPELKLEIARILREEGNRILVLMDDIDRLTPQEIQDVFRTIKAIADFPNVTYLMAFDKDVVIRSLDEFCGGYGENYLEKIVQVPFELPLADRLAVHNLFFERLDAILSGLDPGQFDKTYWANVFSAGISQFLETPRDATRLTNALSLTYRAVEGEVNPVDFVAVESLRLFCPEVYHAIRSNREMFVGSAPTDWKRPTREDLTAFHEEWRKELGSSNPGFVQPVQAMLQMLFPKLESVWGNTQYGLEWESSWRRKLRVCSDDVFPVYFSFAIPRGDLSNSEIQSILAAARDQTHFSERLRQLAKEIRPDGKTRLSAFLDRLQDYTETQIPAKDIEPIVLALFDIGDEFVLPEQMGLGLSRFGNDVLMGQVIWQLLKRVDRNTRFRILEEAFRQGRAIYMMQRTVVVLGQQQGRYPEQQADPEEKWLVSGEQLSSLEKALIEKTRAAAQDGMLLDCPGLPWVLNLWRSKGEEGEAKKWVSETTEKDVNLARFLEKYLQVSTILPLGDAVGKSHDRLDPEWFRAYIDPDQIVDRVGALAKSSSITERQKRALSQLLKEYRFRKAGGNPDSPLGLTQLMDENSGESRP
jgi:predicted KAP-like P-loop ATPase